MRRLGSRLAEWKWPLAAAACACALILLVHRSSPRTLVSAHGLLHAAVAERFRMGTLTGFPPENPFFAGEPLPYYWFFQYAGAKLAAVLGTDPLHAFELMILAGAFAAVLACAALGRRLHGSGASGLALGWLLMAGALPQGAVVLLGRLATWGMPNDDGGYLWGVVHPIARSMRVLDQFSMYGPLGTFFVNVTARPLGIATLALVVLCLHRFLAAPSLSRGAWLSASAALCACFSSLVALAAAGAIGAALLLSPAFRARALATIACLALGLLAASFTYHHLLGRTPLALHDPPALLRQVGRMAESGWLLALLAGFGVRSAGGPERGFLLLLACAASVLALGCALLALPAANEDNLFHAALVLLAVPAAGCMRARWGLVACLAFVPTFAVQAGAFLGRPPIDVAFQGGRIVRADAGSPQAQLYRWIEGHTDERAVFVIDPRPPIRAAGGNSAELPAMTGRAIFTERAGHYLVAPNRDGAARTRIAEALVDGRALSTEDEALVATLGRDVYVVRDAVLDPETAARILPLYGDAVFRAGPISVYRWKP